MSPLYKVRTKFCFYQKWLIIKNDDNIKCRDHWNLQLLFKTGYDMVYFLLPVMFPLQVDCLITKLSCLPTAPLSQFLSILFISSIWHISWFVFPVLIVVFGWTFFFGIPSLFILKTCPYYLILFFVNVPSKVLALSSNFFM